MYESIYKNNELENEMTLDMSYFWYSDVTLFQKELWYNCCMSKDEYACHTVASAKAGVIAMLLDSKLVLYRTEGYMV